MDISNSTTSDLKTRQRVLEAAVEVFAEQGFQKATVRDICKRANANVAAVNYHFRDKGGLYTAVLQYAHQCACEKYPPQLGLRGNATLEHRLQAFVRSLLLRIFDEGRHAWHGKLMSREMFEPTRALDALVESNIRPLAQQLESIVSGLLCARTNSELVRLCTMSIVSQCVFYHHARPVVNRLYPNQKYTLKDVDRLADHITSFSLGAMKEFKKQLESKTK
jgi:AcrR family transcriptional regulator